MAYKPTDTTVINGSTNSPDGNAVYDYVGIGGPFLPLAGGTLTGDVSGTGLTLSGLTTSQIVATDANKKLQTLAIATYPSLTELSYVKGLTSSIQTQLNSKAPLASPTFTGIVAAPAFYTSSNGVFLESGGASNYAGLWGQAAPDTTSHTNYAIIFNRTGTFASLNGTSNASLCVGNVTKLSASSTELLATVPVVAPSFRDSPADVTSGPLSGDNNLAPAPGTTYTVTLTATGTLFLLTTNLLAGQTAYVNVRVNCASGSTYIGWTDSFSTNVKIMLTGVLGRTYIVRRTDTGLSVIGEGTVVAF